MPYFVSSLLFLSILFAPLFCYPDPVVSDAHLRVRKNGVIYYFFSNCAVKNTESLIKQNPTTFLKRMPRRKAKSQELHSFIHEASSQYGVPPSLIKAVIRVESNFNPDATSPKGAQGLMQLMPETAADLQVTNPYDVRENILAGTRYLFMLLEKFNHRLPQALAAYNAGPQRVEKRQAVPPIEETKAFVRNVCVQFLRYQQESKP